MTVARTDSTLDLAVEDTTRSVTAASRAVGAAIGLDVAAPAGATCDTTRGTPSARRGVLRSLRRLGDRAVRALGRLLTGAPTLRVRIAPALIVALPCVGMQPALAGNGTGAGGGAETAGAQADGGQNFELVKDAALNFLVQQTEGLPGKVTISLVPSTPRGLSACGALEPFVPPGVRLWGRAMVGVRCNGERPWTIYLQARIGVIGDYFVAARTLNPGDTIGPQDLEPRHGDLTALPASLVTNPSQVVGAITNNAVTAGFPLRSDMVHAALSIRYGQQVRVIARGAGFAVSSEGSALANAAVGQSVRVRTSTGTVISGIAQPDTSVEVPM